MHYYALCNGSISYGHIYNQSINHHISIYLVLYDLSIREQAKYRLGDGGVLSLKSCRGIVNG